MGFKVNPKEDASGLGDETFVTEGDKVVVPMHYDRYETSQKGTPTLRINFVVVDDLSGKGEEGRILSEPFYLVEGAKWRIAQFADAMGHDEVFDPFVDEDVDEVLKHGAVMVTTYLDEYNGKKRARAQEWRSYKGGEGPDWAEYVQAGVDRYDEFLERVSSGGGSSSSGGPSGGRASGGSSGSSSSSGSSGSYGGRNDGPDDDIPF